MTVQDPRSDYGKRHRLLDIMVIAICAVLCGADSWPEVEEFGRAKEGWFRTFLELPHGVPTHWTFRRVLALLDPQELQASFLCWVQSIGEIASWNIENALHWVLDIAFREAESRLQVEHSAENFAILRRIAPHLLRQEAHQTGCQNQTSQSRVGRKLSAESPHLLEIQMPWTRFHPRQKLTK